jgi:hypothetical protein
MRVGRGGGHFRLGMRSFLVVIATIVRGRKKPVGYLHRKLDCWMSKLSTDGELPKWTK